jgi:hypothetical protein
MSQPNIGSDGRGPLTGTVGLCGVNLGSIVISRIEEMDVRMKRSVEIRRSASSCQRYFESWLHRVTPRLSAGASDVCVGRASAAWSGSFQLTSRASRTSRSPHSTRSRQMGISTNRSQYTQSIQFNSQSFSKNSIHKLQTP